VVAIRNLTDTSGTGAGSSTPAHHSTVQQREAGAGAGTTTRTQRQRYGLQRDSERMTRPRALLALSPSRPRPPRSSGSGGQLPRVGAARDPPPGGDEGGCAGPAHALAPRAICQAVEQHAAETAPLPGVGDVTVTSAMSASSFERAWRATPMHRLAGQNADCFVTARSCPGLWANSAARKFGDRITLLVATARNFSHLPGVAGARTVCR
jgi:hypothetical protein